MDAKQLSTLVSDYFGPKASIKSFNTEQSTVSCVLYESFSAKFTLAGSRGAFTASIGIDEARSAGLFLGEPVSLNTDEASIRKSLERVDEWCRLRLPDKFLEALEGAHRANKAEGEE